MKNNRIPLFDLKLSAATKRQVRQVMTSGWLNRGPKVAEFEKQLATLTSVRHAVALNSATAGLQLTLEAHNFRPGAEVITTPFTFVATAAAIMRAGFIPVLADIDPATLNIDPDEVARKVTRQTACVLPVDIAGHQADYRALRKICSQHELPLIADAAHSLGSLTKNKSTAQLADVAIHSFQVTKNLTCGDGGAVVARKREIVDRVRLLSQHGMTSAAYERKRQGRWKYDVVALGDKANLSDLHAAVGLGQLAVFERDQLRRRNLAKRYRANLAELSDWLETPIEAKEGRHAWHLFIIRLHLSALRISRDRFISLLAQAGIEASVHYRPLYEFEFYRRFGFSPRHFPNATYAGQRVVTLPLYPSLKGSDVDYICDQVRNLVRAHSR